jgi:hypothetical protein
MVFISSRPGVAFSKRLCGVGYYFNLNITANVDHVSKHIFLFHFKPLSTYYIVHEGCSLELGFFFLKSVTGTLVPNFYCASL